jgi:hypothetical protein
MTARPSNAARKDQKGPNTAKCHRKKRTNALERARSRTATKKEQHTHSRPYRFFSPLSHRLDLPESFAELKSGTSSVAHVDEHIEDPQEFLG